MHIHKTFLVLVLAAITVACGGGGGGSGPDTASSPDNKFPVEAAFQKLFTTNASFSATAMTGEQLALTLAPTSPAAFISGGSVSKTFTATQVLRRNGVVLSNATFRQFFTDAPLNMVAYSNRGVSNSSVIPATASVGAAGPFFQIPFTFASRRDEIDGSWAIEAVSANSAYLCLTVQQGPGLNSLISFATTTVDTFCFLIDKNGNASGFKADSASNSRATLNNPVVDRISFR